jgi:hypothetical protein
VSFCHRIGSIPYFLRPLHEKYMKIGKIVPPWPTSQPCGLTPMHAASRIGAAANALVNRPKRA